MIANHIGSRGRTLVLSTISLFTALASTLGGRAAVTLTPVVTDPDGIHGFEVLDPPTRGVDPTLLWWKKSLGSKGEFPLPGHVRRALIASPSIQHVADSCEILFGTFTNVDTDGSRAYYFGPDGRLGSELLFASPALEHVPTPGVSPLPADESAVPLDLRDGILYWAAYGAGYSHLYRVPADGSAPPQYSFSVPGRVRKVHAFEGLADPSPAYEGIGILTETGRLYIRDLTGGTIQVFAEGKDGDRCADFDTQSVVGSNGHARTSVYIAIGDDVFTPAVEEGPKGPQAVLWPSRLDRRDAATGVVLASRAATGDAQFVEVEAPREPMDLTQGTAGIRYGFATVIGEFTCPELDDETSFFCTPKKTVILSFDGDSLWKHLCGFYVEDGGRNVRSTPWGLFFLRDDTIYEVTTICDELSADAGSKKRFRRADADSDGRVTELDARAILEGGDAIRCASAADANRDGKVDTGDAIFILEWLYERGMEPALPGPYECGEDPDGSRLGCEESPCDEELSTGAAARS